MIPAFDALRRLDGRIGGSRLVIRWPSDRLMTHAEAPLVGDREVDRAPRRW
jgi:hypothetical protein